MASENAPTPPAKAGRADMGLLFPALLAISALLVLGTIHVAFLRAPTEKTMGIVQKIFYFHVPSAYSMYLGATACFAGSVAYLMKPSEKADAWARAGAEVSVVFGLCVLVTGPLWAAKAWGFYWTWDPRLTTAMLSFLIYVAYLVLRAFAAMGPASANSPPRSASSAPRTCPSSTSASRSGEASTRPWSRAKGEGSSTPT